MSLRPTALITGVLGQDGIYLARSLSRAGHRVVGTVAPGGDLVRRLYLDGVEVIAMDVRDRDGIEGLLRDLAPRQVFNLAALSSVGQSWTEQERTSTTNAEAVAGLVQALLRASAATGSAPRLFQASSAEASALPDASPYARAKAAADVVVRDARDRHGLYAVSGYLHNHESPLRGERFVTRKIARTVAEISLGRAEHLELGDTSVVRDWGFAGDHVEAMRLMLDRDEPQDLEIGTGVAHTLSDLVAAAFQAAGLGDGTGRVRQDAALLRPTETAALVADPEPAARLLGWRASTTLKQLLQHLVGVEIRRLRSGVPDDPDYLYSTAQLGLV